MPPIPADHSPTSALTSAARVRLRATRRVFPLLLLAVLAGAPLAGCGVAPTARSTPPAADAPAASASAAAASDASGSASAPGSAPGSAPASTTAAAGDPALADPLPEFDLTGEMLFRLLLAEIAVQRGEPGPAFSEFMIAARQSRDPRLARRATEVAISARALAQALEAAELWHGLAPHDVEAEQSYSSLLVANGRYDSARVLLERQLATAPNALEILDRLQRVLAHAPQPAQGLALLESLGRPFAAAPSTAYDAQVILARGARAAGDNAAAVKHARAALAARPDSELAVMTVVQSLLDNTKGSPAAVPDEPVTPDAADAGAAAHTEAVGMLASFVAAHPDAAEARQAYARLLVGEGRLDEGRQQFEELLRRAPQNPDPLFPLGVLALESEHYPEAREYLQRYLTAMAAAPEQNLDLVYLNLARVAEGERRFDEALDWLHKVTSPDQRDGAKEREAFLLGRMNRVDDGLALLRQLPAATAEQRTQTVLAQGQLLRDAHRYDESYRVLDKALQASPDDTGLLYESAMSAERLDRIDLMEARLRHLLQLRPDYAHAYNALGYSLADRNIRLQEAYQLIDHALSLAPDDGFIVDSMGWVQYRLGNLAKARAALTRAFALKADPDVAAHLGEVLWASGDHNGAREVLLNAQKRDGDSDTLRDTLQRLKIQP